MGYIDCDTHVIESAQTFEYYDPSERHLKPAVGDEYWTIEDHTVQWPGPMARHWRDDVFRGLDLADIGARLQYMDDFGVDVQMMFPTWWLLYPAANPMVEAAMYRSYNRWLAERTSEAHGRLKWAVMAPVRTMDRAFEELEFGKAHGASSVFLLGQNHDMSLADPVMSPLYERAQELGLAITVHVGNDLRVARRHPGNSLHSGVMVLPGAFFALLWGKILDRFPTLRWGFMEGGASWLPYVLRETFRADATGVYRSFKDWRGPATEALQGKNVFIATQIEDDLPEILDLIGPRRLVYGTDYGHLDIGSDPDGLYVTANRSDIEPAIARRIVDDNARELLGVDPSFRPAPAPSVVRLPAERISMGLPVPIGVT